MKSRVAYFAEDISKLDLKEVDFAIALLWYFDLLEGTPELRPAFLAELMYDLLRRRVNVTRLGRQLLANRDVMRGKEMGTVRLRHASKPRLSSHYNEIAGTTVTPKIEQQIVPTGLFENTRPYLEALVLQINGTYQAGFYDACALMCRRLLECMLLLALERAGKSEVTRDPDGEYLKFADIIQLASSNRHIKLPRGAGAVLGKIEYLAGHHPTYTTRQKDIDEQRLGFRRVISQLVHLAKIKPKATAGLSADVSASPSP
jgi:hypothetical protein